MDGVSSRSTTSSGSTYLYRFDSAMSLTGRIAIKVTGKWK